MQKVSESEFAEMVGWHPQTVAIWRRAGKIQYRQAGGSIFYLIPEDLDNFWLMTKKTPRVKPAKERLVSGKGF